jgi:hypothetical protein
VNLPDRGRAVSPDLLIFCERAHVSGRSGIKLSNGHSFKAKAKHEKKHQRAEDETSELQLDLEDLNPAWQCFMVESMMDDEDALAVEGGAEPGEFSSFDAEFGTNDNKRNSHGMCVSAAAHGDDVAAALGDDEAESCDEPADDGSEEPAVEEGTDDSTVEEGTDDSTVEEGTDDSTVEEGTDESTVEDGTEEPVADDPADDGSDDQAGEADECESDDTASEDDQAAEDDQGEETEVAAFARALVRFIKL